MKKKTTTPNGRTIFIIDGLGNLARATVQRETEKLLFLGGYNCAFGGRQIQRDQAYFTAHDAIRAAITESKAKQQRLAAQVNDEIRLQAKLQRMLP